MAKSKISLGCLFWIALILLVIVIILANLKTANEIINKTGFDKVVFNFFNKKDTPKDKKPIENTDKDKTPQNPKHPDETPKINAVSVEPEPTTFVRKDNAENTAAPHAPTQKNIITEKPIDRSKLNIRKAKIYFLKANTEGTASLKGFNRSVYFDDEPLKETIVALINGLTDTEKKENYESMIPSKTRLRNLFVKKDTAYIDFNEDFRFNNAGPEGQKAQICQIVFTVTEFSNIKNVQILIEGNKVDYLGPEGIYIGNPLSRDDCLHL
jgi:germination protein M